MEDKEQIYMVADNYSDVEYICTTKYEDSVIQSIDRVSEIYVGC